MGLDMTAWSTGIRDMRSANIEHLLHTKKMVCQLSGASQKRGGLPYFCLGWGSGQFLLWFPPLTFTLDKTHCSPIRCLPLADGTPSSPFQVCPGWIVHAPSRKLLGISCLFRLRVRGFLPGRHLGVLRSVPSSSARFQPPVLGRREKAPPPPPPLACTLLTHSGMESCFCRSLAL